MLGTVLAIIIFVGLGAIAFFGYKTSLELADRLDSGRRRAAGSSGAPES